MKPEVKYPRKNWRQGLLRKYGPIVNSIINRHINYNWDDCVKIIKDHIPEKYVNFILMFYTPDKCDRNGDLRTHTRVLSKENLSIPSGYPIVYIDENNILRKTQKQKVWKFHNYTYRLPGTKREKKIDFWNPDYKIDFEITTNNHSHLSILKYWQSLLLKDNVCLDLENNPVKLKINNSFFKIDFIPIKVFIEFCEKNKYTYRIVERSTLGGIFSKYYYKPFYNDEYTNK